MQADSSELPVVIEGNDSSSSPTMTPEVELVSPESSEENNISAETPESALAGELGESAVSSVGEVPESEESRGELKNIDSGSLAETLSESGEMLDDLSDLSDKDKAEVLRLRSIAEKLKTFPGLSPQQIDTTVKMYADKAQEIITRSNQFKEQGKKAYEELVQNILKNASEFQLVRPVGTKTLLEGKDVHFAIERMGLLSDARQLCYTLFGTEAPSDESFAPAPNSAGPGVTFANTIVGKFEIVETRTPTQANDGSYYIKISVHANS